MRPLLMIGGLWITASCLLQPSCAEAAVVKGRVVDSAGQPVAGAEIRVWRKGPPIGGAPRNQPVSFGGGETLRADDAGRFATPDIFDDKTPVRLVAQAEGMLAGRSGWLVPGADGVDVDDLVLVRLRSLIGRVLDGQGEPVAEATVFNGDGHERVETRTGHNGKFFLEGVPADAVFLFVEKAGYRLSGVMLTADTAVELQLARNNEPIEPLRTREPTPSAVERIAIARRLLDPYLDAVSRQGDDNDKYWTLHELSAIDPLAAFEWLDRIGFAAGGNKERCRGAILLQWMSGNRVRHWDEIRAAIESSDDNGWAASCLIRGAVYYLPETDRDRIREWLDQGLVHANAGPDANSRITFTAWAAEGFWRLGDHDRSIAMARKAEAMAKDLSRDLPLSESAISRLGRAWAPVDLPAALGWLDRLKHDSNFAQECAFVALKLVSIDAAKFEDVWNHVRGRQANDRAYMEGWDRYAADVCYSLAQIDAERARRIAAAVEGTLWRVQARGAVARAAHGAVALEVLLEATDDPALLTIVPDGREFHPSRNSAIALAGLLPIAEGIDPLAAREMLWRALSMRPPKPTIHLLDDETLLADVALAQMVARFEPAIARRLLEPAVRRLSRLASPADRSRQKAMHIVVAASFVDPDWAVELLDRIPEPPDVSWARHAKHQARARLVRVLGLDGSGYWKYAGFWEPSE